MPIYLLSPSTILVVEVIIKLNNMIDKKIEEAKEEIYEDRFLLNGEDVVFDNEQERVKRREYGRDYLLWNRWVSWALSYRN